MNCSKCGEPLGENDVFCKNCGASLVGNTNENSFSYNLDKNQSSYGTNYSNQNFNNQGYSNQSYENQSYGNQNFNNQNYSKQNYNNQNQMNYGNQNNYQNYGSQSNGGYSNGNNYQGGYYNNQYNAHKKSSVGKIILIIIAVIVGLVILGFVALFVIGIGIGIYESAENATIDNTISNTITDPSSLVGPTSSSQAPYNAPSSDTSPTSKSTYKVNFGGFKFYIPDDLIYNVNGSNSLSVMDSENTWLSNCEVGKDISFSTLKFNKTQINQNLSNAGITSSPAKIETINGVEFITIEASNAGTNGLICYASLNSMNTFIGEIYSIDNDYDYEPLKEIADIISKAEYIGDDDTSSFMKGNDSSILSDIVEASKKVTDSE